MKVKVDSMRYKLELKFDEVIEVIKDLKKDYVRKLDKRWEEVFSQVEKAAKALDSRIEQCDG